MERCIFFLAVVASCSLTNGQTYHYDRPQIPFEHHATPQSNYAAPFSTVVRTQGPGGHNYNVQVMDSQLVYEQRQVTASAPGYQQQAQYTALHGPRRAEAHYANAQVGHNQFAYNAGVQQNSAGLGGQQYTSTNANPLTQGGQVQANQINYQAPQQYQQLPNAHYGGVGGAASNYAASGGQQLTGRPGDYVSQSEVGQLDAYAHKQQNGDTRAFTRLITTCYPNGQCERRQLGPGQADPRHQHVVMATRARIQPVSNKCQRIAAAQAPRPPLPLQQFSPNSGQLQTQAGTAASYYAPVQPIYNIVSPAVIQVSGPVRPNNRRLYPYTEVAQPVEPFN